VFERRERERAANAQTSTPMYMTGLMSVEQQHQVVDYEYFSVTPPPRLFVSLSHTNSHTHVLSLERACARALALLDVGGTAA